MSHLASCISPAGLCAHLPSSQWCCSCEIGSSVSHSPQQHVPRLLFSGGGVTFYAFVEEKDTWEDRRRLGKLGNKNRLCTKGSLVDLILLLTMLGGSFPFRGGSMICRLAI